MCSGEKMAEGMEVVGLIEQIRILAVKKEDKTWKGNFRTNPVELKWSWEYQY